MSGEPSPIKNYSLIKPNENLLKNATTTTKINRLPKEMSNTSLSAIAELGSVASNRQRSANSTSSNIKQMNKSRQLEKKQDQKAAKTLSAILLAFIITWTPYNINVVLNTFCDNCLDSYKAWQSFG
jgi:muscarinic acetylcholine receptor M3